MKEYCCRNRFTCNLIHCALDTVHLQLRHQCQVLTSDHMLYYSGHVDMVLLRSPGHQTEGNMQQQQSSYCYNRQSGQGNLDKETPFTTGRRPRYWGFSVQTTLIYCNKDSHPVLLFCWYDYTFREQIRNWTRK